MKINKEAQARKYKNQGILNFSLYLSGNYLKRKWDEHSDPDQCFLINATLVDKLSASSEYKPISTLTRDSRLYLIFHSSRDSTDGFTESDLRFSVKEMTDFLALYL